MPVGLAPLLAACTVALRVIGEFSGMLGADAARAVVVLITPGLRFTVRLNVAE